MDPKTSTYPERKSLSHKQIENVLNRFYPDQIHDGQEELKMDIVHKALPTVIIVLDFSTRNYVHVSENIYEMLGVTSPQLLREGMALGALTVAEENRDIFLSDILLTIMQLYQKMVQKGDDVRNTKLTYNLKMISKEGIIIPTIHIFKPISVNEEGFPLYVAKYIVHDLVGKALAYPEMKFEAKNAQGDYEVIFTKSFFIKPAKNNVLSGREQQILQFVKEGYSSQEIANKLFISLHTVNNHRRNLVKKCGVKNLHMAEIHT